MALRKHLSETEITRILKQAQLGRHPQRDYCLIKMCYTHGFRVSELCQLRLDDIDLESNMMLVRRLKGGLSTVHPIYEHELKCLNEWLSERSQWRGAVDEPWLFLSQKGGQISRQRFYALLRAYGKKSGISIEAHPHMLRHACGYALANLGVDTRLIQDYLGHRNIKHTVIYTASNSMRFTKLWQQNGYRY